MQNILKVSWAILGCSEVTRLTVFILLMICVSSMDACETQNNFDELTLNNDTQKAQNDPWTALPADINVKNQLSVKSDPLHDQISSERYLESLEKKLARIKGRADKEAKASEMISSLQRTKEDQLNQILAGRAQLIDCDDEIDYQDNTVISSIQRKIHPEGQALNPVELYPLINNDFLAKATEVEDDKKSDSGDSKFEKDLSESH